MDCIFSQWSNFTHKTIYVSDDHVSHYMQDSSRNFRNDSRIHANKLQWYGSYFSAHSTWLSFAIVLHLETISLKIWRQVYFSAFFSLLTLHSVMHCNETMSSTWISISLLKNYEQSVTMRKYEMIVIQHFGAQEHTFWQYI